MNRTVDQPQIAQSFDQYRISRTKKFNIPGYLSLIDIIYIDNDYKDVY